jgi:two-component system, sensor histidine kinase PdtaS
LTRIYVLILMFFSIGQALAQTSDLDELPVPELKQKLTASKNDTIRVQLQLALGHLMLLKQGGGNGEIDTARSFAAQAAILSRQLDYKFGIINAMLLSAESHYCKSEDEKGFKMAQQALAFAQKVNDQDGIARSYLMMGQRYKFDDPPTRIAYNNKALVIFKKERNFHSLANTQTDNAELLYLDGKYSDAIKLLFETLKMGEAVSRKTLERIYWHIGRTSAELGDHPDAIKYDLLALKTAKELKDTTLEMAKIYHTISVMYYKMRDFKNAVSFSIKADEIARKYHANDRISAMSFFFATSLTYIGRLDQAITLLKEVRSFDSDDESQLCVVSSFLNVMIVAGKWKEAGIYANEAINLLAKVKITPENVFAVVDTYGYLGDYYIKQGQAQLAAKYTRLYAEWVKQRHNSAAIRRAELRFFKIDSIRGNFLKASQHLQKAQLIKDSIDNVAKSYQISLLNIENQTEDKIVQINELSRQALVRDAQLKRNRIIQKAVIAVAALLLIITILTYRHYRLKNRLVGEKDKLLQEKDLLLKEVNHRVKNNLQIVMSLLASQSGYVKNEKVQEAILESQNRVQAIALIHDQLYRTEKIAEIGIKTYITELIRSLDQSINKKGRKVSINCKVDDMMMDVSQAIPVGIILNESVTNALKYAFPGDQAGEIAVMVNQTAQNIKLRIHDNGVGLPQGLNLSTSGSLGITLIKGLASQLKGKFDMDNSSGVKITITFPKEITAMGNLASNYV